MRYVRTCASTASPQLPSGVELGKRSIDLIYTLPRFAPLTFVLHFIRNTKLILLFVRNSIHSWSKNSLSPKIASIFPIPKHLINLL
ncbi:hypothetical protein, partial [Candidatus Sarmatiella mevalonica]|uniref:hypothetical protein n=1 Tax=Candidatus Sarmatiella mevalonica TaxID=2770581 RepID=UPI0019214150